MMTISDKRRHEQMATIKRRIFAQDRRIAELETQRSRHETLIATLRIGGARLAELEQRVESMVQHYEDLIATFKAREATIENRLRDFEKH